MFSAFARNQKQPSLMTQTKCMIHIQGVALTGHYTSSIRHAAAEPALHSYLLKRHNWEHDTINDIDWDIFRHANRNYSSTDIHLLKLVHDKLPTNLQKSRYFPWVSSKCHFCEEPETFEHLCTSTCNQRSIEFRNKLLQELNEFFLTTNTPAPFCDAYLDAIRLWLFQNTTRPWALQRGPKSLFRRQKAIGWSQMSRGFLSKAWRQYLRTTLKMREQEDWHSRQVAEMGDPDMPKGQFWVDFSTQDKQTPPTPLTDPKRLLAKLITITRNEMGSLWSNHLTFLHQDSFLHSPEHRLELCIQIRMLHAVRPQTLADHRERYFFGDVEEYLRKATNLQMTRYVERYRPAILNSIRQASKIATSTASILSYHGFLLRRTNQPPRVPATREETPHRKHTKVRKPLLMPKITKFFTHSKHLADDSS